MQPSAAEKAALLATLPLFAPLSVEQRLNLANACQWQQWPKGHRLFHEGDTALGMHIVLQGLVKILHITPDGRERILHLIKPGNTCGEAAVFQRGTYPANAETLGPSTTMYVPSALLLDMIVANPDLALNMLAALSMRLRMFTRKLEAHSKGDATKRLAAYLLHRLKLAPQPTTSLRLEGSREVLANMLGIARETLSRTFSRLQQEGILKISGRNIQILDMRALQHASGGEGEGFTLPPE